MRLQILTAVAVVLITPTSAFSFGASSDGMDAAVDDGWSSQFPCDRSMSGNAFAPGCEQWTSSHILYPYSMLEAEGRIFLVGGDGAGGAGTVTALDAASGAQLWQASGLPSNLFAVGASSVNLVVRPAASPDELIVLDAATGLAKWIYAFPGPGAGLAQVDGAGHVWVAQWTGTQLVRLDAASGATVAVAEVATPIHRLAADQSGNAYLVRRGEPVSGSVLFEKVEATGTVAWASTVGPPSGYQSPDRIDIGPGGQPVLLFEQSGTQGDGFRLQAHDASSGAVLWAKEFPAAMKPVGPGAPAQWGFGADAIAFAFPADPGTTKVALVSLAYGNTIWTAAVDASGGSAKAFGVAIDPLGSHVALLQSVGDASSSSFHWARTVMLDGASGAVAWTAAVAAPDFLLWGKAFATEDGPRVAFYRFQNGPAAQRTEVVAYTYDASSAPPVDHAASASCMAKTTGTPKLQCAAQSAAVTLECQAKLSPPKAGC